MRGDFFDGQGRSRPREKSPEPRMDHTNTPFFSCSLASASGNVFEAAYWVPALGRVDGHTWHVVHTVGALWASWQVMHTPMDITLVVSDMALN